MQNERLAPPTLFRPNWTRLGSHMQSAVSSCSVGFVYPTQLTKTHVAVPAFVPSFNQVFSPRDL